MKGLLDRILHAILSTDYEYQSVRLKWCGESRKDVRNNGSCLGEGLQNTC